jgi:hypothetical protein
MRRTAPAQSLTWLEFPAVVLPSQVSALLDLTWMFWAEFHHQQTLVQRWKLAARSPSPHNSLSLLASLSYAFTKAPRVLLQEQKRHQHR